MKRYAKQAPISRKNGQQIGFELLANFMLFRGLNPLDIVLGSLETAPAAHRSRQVGADRGRSCYGETSYILGDWGLPNKSTFSKWIAEGIAC